MKERPINFHMQEVLNILDGKKTQFRRLIKPNAKELRLATISENDLNIKIKCTFEIGDRLWVRETFGRFPKVGIVYRNGPHPKGVYGYAGLLGWIPAQQMRRDESRITLEVLDITAQRLQKISEKDMKAEGFKSKFEFIQSWDFWHDKDKIYWDTDPMVWKVEFKRVK